MKPKVLISDRLSPKAVEAFKQRGIQVDVKIGLEKDELAKIIGNYDGLAVRSATKVSAKLLEKAPRLKVIGRAGIGIDNIDLAAATEKGVIVMNAPMGNSITTAEHTIAMMMALARDIPQADRSTQAGKWEKNLFMGVELTNKTLGIIGCGNVGSLVALRAIGLKMKVIAYDPFLTNDRASSLGIEKVELEDLFQRSDIITLHTPLTPKTKYIINDKTLALMKKNARLINCARGELIDEEALKKAILSGHIGGAALDVFSKEPAKDNILFGLDEVICTPHLGASTTEAQEKVALQIAEQISAYLNEGVISHALNMPSISAEDAARLTPFLELADHLGAFVGQLAEKTIDRIEIEYVGDDIQSGQSALTASLLAAAMQPFFDGINMVSAPMRAKERGIIISENSEGRKRGAYENYIRVVLKEGDNLLSIAGTVFSDNKPRIIQIMGINMEAEFAPHLFYIEGVDRPGLIGGLGQILSEAGLNIASFALGRAKPHGKAITIIAIDSNNDSGGDSGDESDIFEKALLALQDLPMIDRAESMEFADKIIHREPL